MTGLADVDGLLLFIQVCVWPRFPPLARGSREKDVRNVPLVSNEKIAHNVLRGSREKNVRNVPLVSKVMNVKNVLTDSRE